MKARVCFQCQEFIILDSDKIPKEACFNEDHIEHPLATIEINEIKNVKNFTSEDEFYTKIAKYRYFSMKEQIQNPQCN